MTCIDIINKVRGMVKWFLPFYLLTFLPSSVNAQDKIVNPDIYYTGTPRTSGIAGNEVEVDDEYDNYVIGRT